MWKGVLGLMVSCAAALAFGGEEAPGAGHRVTLFYTCDIRGRLVPAACEEGELGGVARMATLFRQWAAGGPDAILVDAGNATAGGHPQGAEAINEATPTAHGASGGRPGVGLLAVASGCLASPDRAIRASGGGRKKTPGVFFRPSVSRPVT